MGTRPPRRPAAARSQSRGGRAQPARLRPRSPLPKDAPLYTPGASGSRRSVERQSARPLLLLHQLPTWLLPAVMAVLLMAGLAVPGLVGGAALVLLAAALGWLAYLSWPALASQGRLLRLATVAGLLVFAVVQARR